VHRKAHASPEVWGLFKDGQLRQSQVDALVTLPPETQKVVALEVVGKGVVETKEVVRAASAAPEGPARLVAALADSLKRVSHLGDNLSLQISESTRLIDALPSISLGGLGAWALLQQATALEPKVREFAVLLRSRAERERNDDDRSGNGTAQGIRSES
jgi:hypothetical protein